MATVTIFLATYNGGKFLREQLESIRAQTFSDWKLYVSDDGSTDRTVSVLKNFRENEKGHEIFLLKGPGKGFVSNFLNMACSCSGQTPYYAFSDQDDIWHKDKIERALEWLKTVPQDIPALYCSRTEIVNEDASPMFPPVYSSKMEVSPSFENALVQSIAGGNTMVFNYAAKELFLKFGGVVPVPSHDWWLYLLVTGVGGKVHYDTIPTMLYRQHQKNIIGYNRSFKAIFNRGVRFLSGEYSKMNSANIFYLQRYSHFLIPENQRRLKYFVKSKQEKGIKGVFYLKKSGAERSSSFFNFALCIGAFLGKI